MKTFLTVAVVSCSALIALPAQAFDTSDYRQNTYGAPNHYCDPARALGSNGAGTLGDPWTLEQAMQLAVAGDVVGILPGVGVALPAPNGVHIPAFGPTHSGTSTSRIVFVTKYAAVALPDVATNPGRTELRHAGTRATAAGQYENGNGGPTFGSYFQSYVTLDGFFVDMAHAQPKGDSGVLRVEEATGVHFRNFEVKGTTTNMQSNPVIYRPQNAMSTVLSNFRAYDFANDTSGSAVPQAALFSDQYGDHDVLIEHFDIRNTERGIFFKGATALPFNYGTVRYGVVSNVSSCFQFNALDPTSPTTVEYNLCYDVKWGGGIVLSSETLDAHNILIHHNTVARVNASDPNTQGGIYSRANGIGANVVVRDNVIDVDPGTFGHAVALGEIAGLPSVLDYNGYTKNGAAISWAWNGAQYGSLAAWQTATSRDAHSIVLASSPFVDRAGGNFRIANGHPAKTASSTSGEIGAFGGSEIVGVDVSPVGPAVDGGADASGPAPSDTGGVGGAADPSSATSGASGADDGGGGCSTSSKNPARGAVFVTMLAGLALVWKRARQERSR